MSEEFIKTVESRRSVRVYNETKVPEEVVQKCLDMALLAPNSSNLQCWEFYWVRNSEKRQALVEACMSQPAAKTAQELIVAVGRTKTWKENAKKMLALLEKNPNAPKTALTYYKKIVPFAYTIGPFGLFGLFKKVLVTVLGVFRPIPREPATYSDMKIWAVKTTSLACQNLMLGFRAFGFDTCPMEGLDSARVRKILKLPRDAIVVMGISVGKRAPNGVYGDRIRFNRDRFIKEV